MTLPISCGSCGRPGRVPRRALGRTVLCPGCRAKYKLQPEHIRYADLQGSPGREPDDEADDRTAISPSPVTLEPVAPGTVGYGAPEDLELEVEVDEDDEYGVMRSDREASGIEEDEPDPRLILARDARPMPAPMRAGAPDPTKTNAKPKAASDRPRLVVETERVRQIVALSVAVVLCALGVFAAYRTYQASGLVPGVVSDVAAADPNDPIVSGSSELKDGMRIERKVHKSGKVDTVVEKVGNFGDFAATPGQRGAPPPPAGGGGTVAPANPFAGRSVTLDELWQACSPSVALVRGNTGASSGFVVGKGLVLTAGTVMLMDFVEDLRVSFPSAPDGKRGPYPAAFVAFDPRRNLALLSVPTDLPPIKVASANEVALSMMGSKVYAFGNPFEPETGPPKPGAPERKPDPENVYVEGTLRSTVPAREASVTAFALTATAGPGMGGGVVFDDRGRAMGMLRVVPGPRGPASYCETLPGLDDWIAGKAGVPLDQTAGAQRARALFRLASTATALYSIGLEYRRKAAENNGEIGDAPDGSHLTMAEIETRVAAIDARFYGRLIEQGGKVNADQSLGDARHQLYDLTQTYDAMKRHFKKPVDGPGYFQTANRLRGECRDHIARANDALHVDLPPTFNLALSDTPDLKVAALLGLVPGGPGGRR